MDGAIQDETAMRGGTRMRETECRRESKEKEKPRWRGKESRDNEREKKRLLLLRCEDCGQLMF
jgi:hypothetical protein